MVEATEKIRSERSASPAIVPESPFTSGALVLVSLQAPREKFWGALLSLAPAGVVLRGISLLSFDDFALQLRSGEKADPLTLFFPMHRVERIELDTALGDLPSLCQRFEQLTGLTAETVFLAGGAAL